MKYILVVTSMLTLLLLACSESDKQDLEFKILPSRIAFGSCMAQEAPKPVLDLATSSEPDLFIFLGDNIYADTEDMSVMRRKYASLATSPEFERLLAATPVIATWDDHDYGANDAGKEYPKKQESKQVFLEFWKEPEDSVRWQHEGIYHAYVYEEHGKTLQIILLDERTFRDTMIAIPNPDPSLSMLGAAQWQWLEEQLQQPADIRIIGSSMQFSHEWNGYESWTNLPAERQRMIDLIKKTKAKGVFFISGDVHWGELSKQFVSGSYDLWDLTSSGITQTWPNTSPNENRIGEVVPQNNYGFVDIDWHADPVTMTLGLVDEDNIIQVQQVLSLDELQ